MSYLFMMVLTEFAQRSLALPVLVWLGVAWTFSSTSEDSELTLRITFAVLLLR